MKRTSLAPLVLCLALALHPGARAEEDGRPDSTPPASADTALPPESEVTRDQIRAVRKGLAWLAETQGRDGSWNEYTEANLAVTSLSVLAFMAQGNTESRGRYHENVLEGVKFLLMHVTLPGASQNDAERGYITLAGDEYAGMHAHGYATLALALAYGMGDKRRRSEIRDRLQDAVHLIERAQDDSGGWYYEPVPKSHEGSVTVCQVQALRAARDAGIRVSPTVIEKAVRYLEKSHDPKTGGFAYSLQDPDRQSYGLTAAALSTLFGLGQYDRRAMILRGLDYLKMGFEENFRGRQPWFFYSNFYAAQTLWQAGATTWGASYWEEWWPRMRKYLVENQNFNGSWSPPRGLASQDLGPAYCTAFSTLILEIPYQLLPLFER